MSDGATAADIPPLTTLTPGGAVQLGGETAATVEFELPVWRRVVKAVATPGAGSTVAGPVRISSSWHWSTARWTVTAPLRVFRSGKIPPGVLALELTAARRGEAPEAFTSAIPDIEVKSAEQSAAAELALASPVETGRAKMESALAVAAGVA